jgi:polyhydroxyalkanoate synthesis regulator phasin
MFIDEYPGNRETELEALAEQIDSMLDSMVAAGKNREECSKEVFPLIEEFSEMPAEQLQEYIGQLDDMIGEKTDEADYLRDEVKTLDTLRESLERLLEVSPK